MATAARGAADDGTVLVRQDRVLQALAELRARVSRIEGASAGRRTVRDEPAVRRVKEAAGALPLLSARFLRVPSTYYEWSLLRRRRCLAADSIHQLCKTILLENTHCTRTDCGEPRNSRYYAIIIQYTTKLQSHKVFRFVRSLNPDIGKKNFKFTLAPEEVSEQLTGFGKGAICPVGMNTPVPVIISDRILRLQPSFMWLGGGHIDVKMGCDVQEFVKMTNCYVADVVHDEEETTLGE